MRTYGTRVIKINRKKIIARIEKNKKVHIAEYKKAVIAYKEEALRQLDELLVEAADGRLNIQLNLISPIDNSKRYDEIKEMFQWEISTNVELTQDEFKDYVQDESSSTRTTMMTNALYMSTT